MTDPVRERRIDIAICASLALATVVAAGVTAQSLGFTRDEGYYFKAAELYWGWFRELLHSPASALSFASIDRGWSYNHEHPALLKTLFAWSFGLDDALGMPVATHNAMRLPAWCVAGVAVAVTYALARAMLSRRAAVLAALLFVCMPRVFWHMHLSCFDVGVTAAHTALVLAYVRYRHTNKGALVVGIAFGLCAAVKHNVIPVPAILVLHYLLTEMTSTRRIPLAFLSMMFVGPLVYLAHWPWLWPHPFERFGAYVAYHLGHENYPILYFGDLLTHPPFPIAFPFVMSAVTIPVPTLVAMILGVALGTVVAVRFLRARFASAPSSSSPSSSSSSSSTLSLAGGDAILLLLNAAYPFVLIALPSTPKFGGTKHWMNALPFLCVLAAFACEEVARRLQIKSRVAWAIATVVVVTPGVWISARDFPYNLGSYNELIGFARGAANVGMQRTFWGYEPLAALPFIDDKVQRGGSIHFGDTNADDYRMYTRDNLLRKDIPFSNTVRGSSVASVEPQGEFKEQWLDVWNDWGDRTPDLVLGAEGVPFATITLHDDEGAHE